MKFQTLNRNYLLKGVARKLATDAQKVAKEKVLIVGTGWAGFRLAQDIDKSRYDVQVVSPRNHFLFTPMLPSTAVGTLEFRSIQEHVRTIPNISYFHASVTDVDFMKRTVECADAFDDNYNFQLDYDALILAPGCKTNTLGIEGVSENDNVFFLKQLSHARGIRNRIIDLFERASSPGTDQAEIEKLLSFLVVGGGPTSVEFAAEMYDFLVKDVSRWYPELRKYAKVRIVEVSGHILPSFQDSLSCYVENLFASRNIEVLTETAVKKIEGDVAVLSNDEKIPFGLMVWATGITQIPLVRRLAEKEVYAAKNGRLLTDQFLRLLKKPENENTRVEAMDRVFALGDCACEAEKPLPPLAQVASQQGKYLAKHLNRVGIEGTELGFVEGFKYQHLGALAEVGDWKGVYDSTSVVKPIVGESEAGEPPVVKGALAFFLWRAAYWTRQVSWTNRLLIPVYWLKSAVFGRDISRF